MANIGDRVKVDLRRFFKGNKHLKFLIQGIDKYDLEDIIPKQVIGTVRRIASNGAIGIEFDWCVLDVSKVDPNVGTLHHTAKNGYGVYINREYLSQGLKTGAEVIRTHHKVGAMVATDINDYDHDLIACI